MGKYVDSGGRSGLTIDMNRRQYDAVDCGDSWRQESNGQAWSDQPIPLAGNDARHDENVVSNMS